MAYHNEQNEEVQDPEQPDQDTQPKPAAKPKSNDNGLPLPSKFYVKVPDLMDFLYPADALHPHATLRLFLYAEYGPLFNHHSYECLCNKCKQKCKSLRSTNDTAKQLYFGKILIGTDSLKIDDESLDFLCSKCKLHCSTIHHLKSGPRNLHIVNKSELTKMEQEIQRNDLLSCFVSRKEQLSNPLTVEEEDELIGRQPLRVKFVPNLSKQDILDLFQKLPIYKMKTNTSTETEPEQNTTVNDADADGVDDAVDAEPAVESKQEKHENVDANATDAENVEDNENLQDAVTESGANGADKEEEDEGEDVLSFYDISAVVRKVREQRKKDLMRRSVTTQDPVRNGPPRRPKAVGSWALAYTDNKMKHKLAECELSDVTTSLLHTFAHEITTLKHASEGGITQNVRMLRHLQKDNATNWDPNCCLRGSNRLTNTGK